MIDRSDDRHGDAEPSRVLDGVAPNDLPRHVALIMDGNGRWARRRGLLRVVGHESGAESLRRITRRSRALGISELTFYALSTENYTRRPRAEVEFLMGLLRRYLIDERDELMTNDIRLRSIGSVEDLPDSVVAELRTTEKLTAENRSMRLRLALNYGGRQEIIAAVNSWLRSRDAGSRIGFDEDALRANFYDPEMSDPDLLIRTAGEYRLSNFLLWQCSYSELWVTETLWPDFGVEEFDAALRDFARRERKYGAVGNEPERGSARR